MKKKLGESISSLMPYEVDQFKNAYIKQNDILEKIKIRIGYIIKYLCHHYNDDCPYWSFPKNGVNMSHFDNGQVRFEGSFSYVNMRFIWRGTLWDISSMGLPIEWLYEDFEAEFQDGIKKLEEDHFEEERGYKVSRLNLLRRRKKDTDKEILHLEELLEIELLD